MKDNFKKEQSTLIRAFFVLLFAVGFSVSIVAQEPTTPQKATFVKIPPSALEVLNALNGGGLTLSNPKIVAGYMGQMLIFKDGLRAGLGMDSGVLFATGKAQDHMSKRNTDAYYGSTYDDSYDGVDVKDADLINIYPNATKDVVIYTFDVTMASHTKALRVAFQFGSEEYPTYVGTTFNDAFGFFVSGPGLDGTVNMAKLPNGKSVISINTVNGGRVGSQSGQIAKGTDLTQSHHYTVNGHDTTPNLVGKQDNRNNNGDKPVYIEYNGLTKLITYDLTGLQGGKTYKFKIAIADSGDRGYDSGVIIQKIQGTTGADVKIEKKFDKKEVHPGEEIEFTLTATNLGPYKGTNTKVTDLLPSGYTFVSATPSKGTYDEKTGIWTIGDLEAVHETATLKVKAIVKLSGDYTNTAIIKSNDPDPDSSNNTAVVTPNVTPWPKDCGAPAGAKELTSNIKKIASGQIYRVSKDVQITGDLVLEVGGELYIESGAKLKITGTFTQSGGLVKICPTGGIDIDGSANFGGANLGNNATLTLYEKAFFSVTGALTQGDPSHQGHGANKDSKAVINMYDGAFVEVCGTFMQQSTTYPLINYRGVGDMNAYFINKANASGGIGTVVSYSENVNWILMGPLEQQLNKGNTQFCGPNATKETCPNMWPEGLTNAIADKCHEAEGILNSKPSIKLEKTGVFNDVNENGYADVNDTISYTFKISNTGNIPLQDVVIEDTKLGTALKIVYYSGDVNNDKKLDKEEVWLFTAVYAITKEDINKKGVYNIATVSANDGKGKNVTSTSTDPKPLPETTPGHPGIDKNCPTCTIVILKGQSLFITNPHIYQRFK